MNNCENSQLFTSSRIYLWYILQWRRSKLTGVCEMPLVLVCGLESALFQPSPGIRRHVVGVNWSLHGAWPVNCAWLPVHKITNTTLLSCDTVYLCCMLYAVKVWFYLWWHMLHRVTTAWVLRHAISSCDAILVDRAESPHTRWPS